VKILYVSPHLSTGGLPQFLLKKIQVLINEAEVYCVEYANHGGFIVQREQIKNLLKSKFVELGENKFHLLNIIKEIAPDVVHFEEMPEYFMDMALAQKIYTKERSYLIFETSHDSSFDAGTKRVFPDKFTFVSEFQKRNVEVLGIPSEVHEYPIVLKTRPQRNQALKILGLDPNKKHVVNVGLFTPRKNQAEIIEYAKKLKDYPIQFHFIGNQADNFKFYWEPLMKDFPSNCTWWNERKDVENFYQAADLFLFTSRGTANNKETSPLVIREAISFNLPSLIYNLPVYLGMYDKYDNVKYLNFDNLNENCDKILNALGVQKKLENSDVVFIVSSYPNSRESGITTKQCLDALKQFGPSTILVSHCDVPQSVQESADYVVVDKKRNILTYQSYYIRYWQTLQKDGVQYKASLFLDSSLNDTYHGPAVYTNYYNGISLAKKLGYKKGICLNFDFILKDRNFFNKVYEKLINSDGYFVHKQEPEGSTIKTVFHAVDFSFFEKNFPEIKTESDYNNWWKSIGSESNGLENIYSHTLKGKTAGCYMSSFEEYERDISGCDIDSNSQVEYFSVLPISDKEDKIAIFFCSSNTKDSRKIEIEYPNGKISNNINGRTTIMEFVDKPLNEVKITAKVSDLDGKFIYKKEITINKEYLETKLKNNGIVQKI
jgi:glycosyltransferase involved in cell wall biosynthesis